MADAPILGSTEKLTLDADVFGAAFNGPLVHEVVIAELAARRRGTHATRTRGRARAGGAAPGGGAPSGGAKGARAAPARARSARRTSPAAASSSARPRATTP